MSNNYYFLGAKVERRVESIVKFLFSLFPEEKQRENAYCCNIGVYWQNMN